MRVAIGIHGDDLENVKKTYDNISLKQKYLVKIGKWKNFL
jgi:hypothetical protein